MIALTPEGRHSVQVLQRRARIFVYAVRRQRTRDFIIEEIVRSEETYVAGLEKIQSIFWEPLGRLKNSGELRVHEIFRDLEAVIATHTTLRNALVEASNSLPVHDRAIKIAQVMQSLAPYLKQTTPYIQRFEQILKLVEDLHNDKGALKVIQDGQRTTSLTLQAHLITPVQRVPRLELLWQKLVQSTERTSEMGREFSAAYSAVKGVAGYFNQAKYAADMQHRVATISLSIRGIPQSLKLLEPGRILLHEGKLQVYSFELRELHELSFFLFKDLLLWAELDMSFQLVFVGSLDLTGARLRVHANVPLVDVTHYLPHMQLPDYVDRGFMLETNMATLTLFCPTLNDKANWLAKLS
eukprot:c46472_g1_i1.p1 GENE.c46472_g1_i1~~c46472_g1_i1.p1  ORF type:complete len:406 (+),score=66.77 c46472_g1_i1:158-1219(+)